MSNKFDQRTDDYIRSFKGVMILMVLFPFALILTLGSLVTVYAAVNNIGFIEGDKSTLIFVSLIELILGIAFIVVPISYIRRGRISYYLGRIYSYLVILVYIGFLTSNPILVALIFVCLILADKYLKDMLYRKL